MKKTKSIRYFILCLMCVYVLSGCKSEPEPFDIDEVSVPVNIIEVSPDENSGDTSMTSEDSESKDIYSKIGYSWSLDDAQALVRSGKIDFTLEKAWAVDNIEKIPGTSQSFYADGSFFIYSENGDIIKDVRYPDFIMEDGSFIGGGQIILLEISIHNQDAISEVAVVDEYTSPYLFRADFIIRVQHDGSELYPYYFEQAGKYVDHPMLFQVNPGEDETICVGFYVSGNIDGTCRDLYYSAFYVRVALAFPVQIKNSSWAKIFAVVYSRIFSPGAFYVIMGIPRQKKTGASLPSTSCFHSRQTMTHGIKYQILRKCSLSYSFDDTMITIQTGNFNPFLSNCSETSLQRIYSSMIADLPLHQIQCPHCHHHGSFYLWGVYQRNFRLPDSAVSLRIQRIRCNSCGHTHALLPDWIIPYSQIRLSVCAAVIVASESDEGAESLLEKESTIDENNVAAILRSFRKHWKQRLISAGLGLSDLLSLVRGSFAHFSRQFMQIKSTPNILFSLST